MYSKVLIFMTFVGLIVGSPRPMKKDNELEREEVTKKPSSSSMQASSPEGENSGVDWTSNDSSGGTDFFRTMMDMFGGDTSNSGSAGQAGQLMEMIQRQMQAMMAVVSDMMGSFGSMRGGPLGTMFGSNTDAEVLNMMRSKLERKKRMADEIEATTIESKVEARDEMRDRLEKYLQKTRETIQHNWAQITEALKLQGMKLNATMERALTGAKALYKHE